MAGVLVVAGVASGVGKTTITLGLLEAYRRRGLVVQAFKVGPDFIDSAFHAMVTGRPSYNLDGWMCGREHVLRTVARHATGADLVVVEGVMGCFDGLDAQGDDGSTAQVAKWLRAPVLLVMDTSAQSRSAAAVVQGFERFDAELNVAAVIANRVGSERHGRWVVEAIANSCRAVPVGAVARDRRLEIPERHLGLVTAVEGVLTAERRKHLADAIEASLDLDRLLALARPLPSGGFADATSPGAGLGGGRRGLVPVRIGVARDAAFQFYYADNLDALRAAGAELVSWSPLEATDLPEVNGLYFGGGYPELHAGALSANANLLKAIATFVAAGRPVYAECGGLMYLAEALEDMTGVPHRMAGVLPAAVRLNPPRLRLAYTEVRFVADTPLGPAGTLARGHEFHVSTLDAVPTWIPRAYQLIAGQDEPRPEGYLVERALMSYVHLHFGSNPALAHAFVAACGEGRDG